MDKFSSTNKEQDFSVWVRQFEDAINRSFNPHSRRRHHGYCLQWLPSLLHTEAYAIWERADARRSDWEKLKNELELTYEDPAMRTEWKNNLKAYVWDEKNVPLQNYCAKVKRYVDTFETEMAECPAALKGQYYLRFFNGLPEDYQGQVTLSLTAKSQDIEKAMDVCLRFQSFKKNQNKKETASPREVGAAVTFEDRSVPARITNNEMEIVRMKNWIKKLEHKHSAPATTPNRPEEVPQNAYAGRSPYRPPRRFDSQSNQSRDEDRMKRFIARKRGGGNFYRPRSNTAPQQRPMPQQQRQEKSVQQHQQQQMQELQQSTQQAGLEEGLALESEYESEHDWAEDTMGLYGQFCQEEELERVAQFGRVLDSESGN